MSLAAAQPAPTGTVRGVGGEMQTAVRHSVVYGLGSILAKALGFLMLPFYTHYLSPADYGVLEILDLSMSLLGMFLNMGMTAAMMRSFARAGSESEKHKVVSTSLLFAIASAAIMFILTLGAIRPVSARLLGFRTPPIYLLVSLSSLLIGYVANLPRTYLRALEASSAFVGVETISLFALLGLNVLFIAWFGLGLFGILLSSLLVNTVQTVVLCWWAFKRVGLGWSLPQLAEMVRFGLPLIFSNVGLFTLNFSDRFFLQHFQSIDAVGVYAVGYKFAYMINFLLVQPFYVMWEVRMYVVHENPEHPRIFGEMFALYSLLLIYAALGLSMLSPEIVDSMVNSRFKAASIVIPPIALAYVFSGIGYYTQVGMFLAKRTALIGAVSAVAAVLNLVLNYVLISSFGIQGAAWATLLSFFAIAAGSFWCSQRVYPLPFHLGRIAAALVLGVGLFLLPLVWSPASIVGAIVWKSLLLLVFPLLVWKGGLLSPTERETLVSIGESTLARFARSPLSGRSFLS